MEEFKTTILITDKDIATIEKLHDMLITHFDVKENHWLLKESRLLSIRMSREQDKQQEIWKRYKRLMRLRAQR